MGKDTYTHTEETLCKMRLARKGRRPSLKILPDDEIKVRYLSGESPKNISILFGVTDNTIRLHLRNIGVQMRTLSESQSLWLKGLPKTEEHKHNLSIAKMGKPAPKPAGFGELIRKRMTGRCGADHPCWRGRQVPFRNNLLKMSEYVSWRLSVYERDNFTCQECYVTGGDLQAHHKVPVTEILRKFNITTYSQAQECQDLWLVDNGITLCKKHHSELERKLLWQPQYR